MSHRQRKLTRLQGYDYAQAGAYFVTICTQHRHCLFGSIKDGVMSLNPAGEMIVLWWGRIPERFPNAEIDYFVVMPNHVHGIVVLDGSAPSGLSDAVGWFKTMTTNAYIHGVKEQEWTAFDGQFWQRSYHDHIIRNEPDLNRIREYVMINPARWDEDTLYAEP